MTTATVKSISKISDINADSSVFKVEFDNDETALMIAAPDEPFRYLNALVDYETRKDIYEGSITDYITTVTEKKVVNTLTRTDHIKLFADSVDNSASIAFADIEMGETYVGCVFYCSKVSYNSSVRSDWAEFTISDRLRRVAKLKLFSPNVKDLDSFAGRYIRCDVRKTKFGFTTQDVFLCDKDYAPNPELDIAERYLLNFFKPDADMSAMLEKSNIIPFMKEYVGYERGCLLLECAMEVDLAIELCNVTSGLDVHALTKAFVADKLWCLNINSHYSKQFLNLHNCLAYKAALNARVQDIIGGDVPNVPEERLVYNKIKELVRALVITRKGDVYED